MAWTHPFSGMSDAEWGQALDMADEIFRNLLQVFITDTQSSLGMSSKLIVLARIEFRKAMPVEVTAGKPVEVDVTKETTETSKP